METPQDERTSGATTHQENGAGRRTVVIGGGVIGAACAHYLARAGHSVTICERNTFGGACSHGNCGYVSPSHILPLCRPGAISSTLKTMFQKNSPFYLKPRIDLALWDWMLRFARRCNRVDMLEGGRARQALLDTSRTLYQELFDGGELTDCDWETIGLIFVFLSETHFEHYHQTNDLLKEEFGLGAIPLAGTELTDREPALKPGIAGGWLYECDAHLRPDKLMAAWRRRLEQDGIEIREQCEIVGWERQNGSVRSVRTTAGNVPADHVVVATGAWTPLLKEMLGRRLPIQPGKGYSITMPRPARCPRYPMIFEEHRVAVTPMAERFRIGSTMEFAGYDTTLNRGRLKLLTEGAKRYLHEPMAEPIIEEWYGWRPMSCDGKPIIGPVPGLDNAWVASGHSMLGISMATGTGRLVSELINGSAPHVDPEPYRPDRF